MATTTQFETAQIDDLTRDGGWAPLRRHFGVTAFGINAWTAAEAGGTLVGEHDETRSGHEELYVVLTGRATFTVAGETLEAVPGTVVFVRDPATKRTAVAREAVAERESFAELARGDEDLASLRGDARFEEIVGAMPG